MQYLKENEIKIMQYLKRDSNTGGSCDICENF